MKLGFGSKRKNGWLGILALGLMALTPTGAGAQDRGVGAQDREFSISRVDPDAPLVSIYQTLTTPLVFGDRFFCYVVNTSPFPVSVVGVLAYDRDGRLRAEDSGPGPTCPVLESSHPPLQLLPHQTCVLKATKSVSGSSNVGATLAYCALKYSPRIVKGVRLSISARHDSYPNDSMTLPGYPQ